MMTASPVEDVLRLSVPGASGDGLIVTLGIYLDKSGPTDAIPAVTTVAVIARVDDWIALTEEWAAALHDFEELPYFHMTDFESGYSFYKDWNERGVKKERLARLLSIIEKRVLAVAGASVSVADCSATIDHTPLETAFSLTASHCFAMIPQYRYLHDHPEEDVLYVFESGDQGFRYIEHVYDEMNAIPWRRAYHHLGGKLAQDEKKFPPLQVADLFAFEAWKQWSRDHGGETRPMRYPFKRLAESIPAEWATLRPMTISELWDANDQGEMPTWLRVLTDGVVQGRPMPTAPLTLPTWG